jgi:hopanoid biosynthesis associated protein HpnK
VRRLIVNADDLGLTRGVNRGIVACHTQGIVTSSTLMANGPAFDDAVRQIRAFRSLSVGCHIVLVDGAPLLPPAQVRTLLTSRARFRDSLVDFMYCVVRGRISEAEIENEATAQIQKMQRSGLLVSHLDTHKHTHMLPAVLRPVLRAAQTCGVPAIRNPFAPVRPLAYASLLRRPRLWTRYSEIRGLRRFRAGFERAVQAAGLITTEGTFGILSTGALDHRLFRAIIGCMPEGTWEFVCHPGYSDADLARVRTRLRVSRDLEREVLTSPQARAALQHAGIELINYAALAEIESPAAAPQSNPHT